MKAIEMNRRTFLGGLATGGAALALGMSGCAANNAQASKSSSSASAENSGSAQDEKRDVNEIVSADIVIVGGGMSGLAAATQAALNGDNVVVLEAAGALGGAGSGVEGMFGANSSLQKQQGIVVDTAAVLSDETKSTNYTNSGLMWRDMLNESGNVIDWLIEQGVEFSGKIDGYFPNGRFPGYHWFKNGHAREGYVPQMVARTEELGVVTYLNTRAEELIFADSKIGGVIAKKNDGAYLQVDAPAVILAAGGFIGDTDLLSQQMNIAEGEMAEKCLLVAETLHRMGDGVKMAAKIGGRLYPGTCIEGWCQPEGLPIGDAAEMWNYMVTDDVSFRALYVDSGLFAALSCVWVEEHAQRFTNEGALSEEVSRSFSIRKFYKEHYTVFDQAALDIIINTDELKAAWEKLVSDFPDSIKTANTIEDLAGKAGLDAASLKNTIDRYNGFCGSGVDEDFARPAESLHAVNAAPYYIFRNEICGDATLGGICVNRDFQALDSQKNPIAGLFMAGVDGCMLYNCVYPIGIGGTACCNSVYSGRSSANSAHSYLQ